MNRFLSTLLILLCTLIWGTAFLAQKTGSAHFGPFALTCFRNLLAGLFLLGVVTIRDCVRPSTFRHSPYFGGMLSGFALFAAMLTQQLGIESTTPGISAFLTANYILMVPILAWIIGKGRPKLGEITGVPLALIGTFLICIASASEFTGVGKGELWTLLCAFFFAVQIMIVGHYAPNCDVLKFSMVQMFVASLCAAPFIALPAEISRLSLGSFREGWFALVYLGVGSSGIAYTLQNLGQAHTPPALAALVMSFESVVGAVSGYLYFGDILTPSQLCGCVLVFMAIVISQMLDALQQHARKLLVVSSFVLFAVVDVHAITWKSQPFNELRDESTRFAETNGFPKLAEKLRTANATYAWIPITLDFCEKRLKELGPREYTDPELMRVLRLLDYPLHVDNYSPELDQADRRMFESSVIDYQKRAISRVLAEVKAAVIPVGTLRAWHIYNMAYVLKGSKHTVLIDFTPYPFSTDGSLQSWTDDAYQAYAELGDILVITHPHRDHTSYPLMAKMRKLNKQIVLPCAMTNRADGAVYQDGERVRVLAADHAKPVDIGGVKFWNFMGFQGDVPCNTYLMEIDGVRVVDNGDNSPKWKEWELTKCPPADIIISSTWSWVTNIVTACQATPGFKNDHAIFLPSHDNEIMHTVPHRESYREMYESEARLGCPDFKFPRTYALGWGESVEFKSFENNQMPKKD